MAPHIHDPQFPSRREALAILSRLAAGLPLLSACHKRENEGAGGSGAASGHDAAAGSGPPPPDGSELVPEKGKGKSDRDRPKVALLLDSLETPIRNFQQVFVSRLVATQAGVDLTVVQAAGDAQRQITQLRFQAAQGARYFLVFPVHPEVIAPVLMELKAAGATIIVFSRDLPATACTSAIFSDEKKIGEMAGDFVISALRQKSTAEGRPETVGRVVQITGPEGSSFSQTVSTAFQTTLQKAPGVVLVHDAPANWASEEGGFRFNDALRLQKQFDVVFAHSDFMALGAAKAARATQPPIRDSLLILGLDGLPGQGGGLNMVINSEIDASIYQPPLVDLAWKICRRLLEDPTFKPKARYELSPQLITLEAAEIINRKGLPTPGV